MNNLIICTLLTLSTAPAFSQIREEYRGSSYSEIHDLISLGNGTPSDPEERAEFDIYQRGELPHYQVTRSSLFKGGVSLILNAAKRTTSENYDTYPRVTKLVHANGVCVAGTWNITQDSKYTGYFAKGKNALFIGRASVALSDTEQGYLRGFGLAGKLFPTDKKDEVVKTANFFTADDLGGTTIKHFTATALTNEPALSFRFSLIKLLLAINSAFSQVDTNPGFRPLYPVSELGLTNPNLAVTPKWMKLEPEAGTLQNNEADFRDELNIAKYYPQGMRLNIYVSDTTGSRLNKDGWTKIGYIQLNESFVSYGCDRQLHFAHPKMK